MKRGAHLLAPGPENIKGGFVRKFMLLLDGINVGDEAHKKERVHPCNVCDKAVKSLQRTNQHTIWQHSGQMFAWKGCGKKFKTNNSINRTKKLFGCKPHHRKSVCNFDMWGKGVKREKKDCFVQLKEEGRHPLPSQSEIYYL